MSMSRPSMYWHISDLSLSLLPQTRMQSLSCDKNHGGIGKVLRTMVAEEGLFRPMRGMNAMAAGAGPAHAMYFTALEKVKHNLVNRSKFPEHASSGERRRG